MRKNSNNIKLEIVLMLGDILAMNAGFIFSYWLRFYSGFFKVIHGVPHINEYLQILPVLTVVFIFLMRSEKLYSWRSRISITDEIFIVVKVMGMGLVIFMAGTFVYRDYSFSRGIFLIAWIVLILFVGGWRLLVNRIRFFLRARSICKRNLLLIGDSNMVNRLINHISGDFHWDYDIKGIVRIKSSNKRTYNKVPILGDIKQLNRMLREHEIDEVIITETELSRSDMMDIILECEKQMVEFRLVADILGVLTADIDMRTIDGVPLLGGKESPLDEGLNRFIKRAMDIIVSLIFLVLLLPVFLVIALAVKLSTPGPIFYLQKRIGEDGRRFAIIKFRTMKDKAEKGVGRIWAKENDPRRTSLGSFLRRTNLDELPQILNVIRGEMSLVGPRPERPHFVRRFRESVPRYMTRHKIKSGITGWAQVNGLRGNTSIEERTKYDLYYVENWSLAFDVKILFMSIVAVKNAY